MCNVHVWLRPCECVSFLSAVRIMTSNTNPLDWDYSSSTAAAGKPQAKDWTSLARLPVSLAVCLRSVPHTGSMTSSMRSTLSFFLLRLHLCFVISLLATCFLFSSASMFFHLRHSVHHQVPLPATAQLFAAVCLFFFLPALSLYRSRSEATFKPVTSN